MKHLNAEKYNVAWFRLAECVSRKEKERALGVYRLLSHSLGNDAIAAQLYGDLLLCFDDKDTALEKYKQAAQIYKDQNNIIESIAVYEHIVTLQPYVPEYIFELFQLYQIIEMPYKILRHVKLSIADKKLDFAEKIIEKIEPVIDTSQMAEIRTAFLFAMLEHEVVSKEKVTQYIETIIDCWTANNDEHMLSEFLQKLALVNESFYEHALAYVSCK